MSYFDLGLSSLAITTLVHKVNKLLDVTLSPSALFEQKDIQSLAAYLAATYQSKVEAINVSRYEPVQIHLEERKPRSTIPILLHEQTEVLSSRVANNGASVPEEVWWQEVSLSNGYEKVTF
jgi:hypothetical protein